MPLTVADVMQTKVDTVSPDMALPDLERAFIERGVGGFPVVAGGKLVGIVSRSDVVRQLCVEQSVAEHLSDYYAEHGGGARDPVESFEEIGRRVGARIETLHVRDVMVRALIRTAPGETVAAVARTLIEHGVHRLPVVDGDELVGIVSSLDLVRLFAEDRVAPA